MSNHARCNDVDECNNVKSGDPSCDPSELSLKLVLVERGNPTYNFVRLQEGKLRGRGHKHTYTYDRKLARMDYMEDGTATRYSRRRKIELAAERCSSARVDAHARARIPRRGRNLINANLDTAVQLRGRMQL